jgi:putative transposase
MVTCTVERPFTAPAPDRLWVADITSHPHVLRLGLHTDLALEPLEMGMWSRQAGRNLPQLTHHSDWGVQ